MRNACVSSSQVGVKKRVPHGQRESKKNNASWRGTSPILPGVGKPPGAVSPPWPPPPRWHCDTHDDGAVIEFHGEIGDWRMPWTSNHAALQRGSIPVPSKNKRKLFPGRAELEPTGEGKRNKGERDAPVGGPRPDAWAERLISPTVSTATAIGPEQACPCRCVSTAEMTRQEPSRHEGSDWAPPGGYRDGVPGGWC